METYVLLVLDIAYSYTALMLLFGAAHLCSLLCGAGTCWSKSASGEPALLREEVMTQLRACHMHALIVSCTLPRHWHPRRF